MSGCSHPLILPLPRLPDTRIPNVFNYKTFFFIQKSIKTSSTMTEKKLSRLFKLKLGHKKAQRREFSGIDPPSFSVGALPNSLLQSVFASSFVLAFLIFEEGGKGSCYPPLPTSSMMVPLPPSLYLQFLFSFKKDIIFT